MLQTTLRQLLVASGEWIVYKDRVISEVSWLFQRGVRSGFGGWVVVLEGAYEGCFRSEVVSY